MRAVICTGYGPPEVLKIMEVETPRPKEGEVLIKVISTTVNSGDARIRGLRMEWFFRIIVRLIFGFTKPRRSILGTTFSGIIEEVGNKVEKFKIGDEVFGSTGLKFGTYAEYITLHDTGVLTFKPKNFSFDEAAAILFGGMTATYFLQKAGIESMTSPRVLIYGATGSVGTAAIEIAKYYNANVTSVCSKEGIRLAKNLGSDDIVIYSEQDFRKLSNKFDIVFDAVGKTKRKEVADILKEEGKYLTVGGSDVAKESRIQLDFLRNLSEKGKIKANIDMSYHLEDVTKAHRYVDTERKKGNVILKVNN